MNDYAFTFVGQTLSALGDGALFWPAEELLVVSDLHLGRSERYARRGGALLPPYEVTDTLTRLDAAIGRFRPRTVICLGDSFDDIHVTLGEDVEMWLARMMAGRVWIWIAGNHDPAPVSLGGTHSREYRRGPIVFRHAAERDGAPEVSGHFHPKIRIAGQQRACFLCDGTRVILPAFGTYTGGLSTSADAFDGLLGDNAIAVLTGPTPCAVPLRR